MEPIACQDRLGTAARKQTAIGVRVCVCCYAKQGKILKLWTNGRVNPTPHRVVDIVRSYRALRY
jgi:hypothetical protein